MALRFTDKRGQCGRVTESLEVEYSGAWEQEVRDAVADVRQEKPDDDMYEPENPLSYLVMELPESAPITEVAREDIFSSWYPE